MASQFRMAPSVQHCRRKATPSVPTCREDAERSRNSWNARAAGLGSTPFGACCRLANQRRDALLQRRPPRVPHDNCLKMLEAPWFERERSRYAIPLVTLLARPLTEKARVSELQARSFAPARPGSRVFRATLGQLSPALRTARPTMRMQTADVECASSVAPRHRKLLRDARVFRGDGAGKAPEPA